MNLQVSTGWMDKLLVLVTGASRGIGRYHRAGANTRLGAKWWW
jgi:NAD(P)-dependent dehydrogenase (short-subunit alcohol dehydrogenase family)